MEPLLNWKRIVPLLLGCVMMCLTLTSAPFDRYQLTIPLTLAIGFVIARWYTSLPREQLWRRLGAQASWPRSALLPVALTLVLSLLPSLFRGHFPYPGNHDEMSYHLAADTFLHGRLANPTPPGWEHFESFHINMRPSYCSKYQPGMGLMLALGQLLGHPYLGVLLALALATFALSWMFHQWLPRSWAMAASLLACFPLCGNWSDCYFVGGPLATIPGALLLGLYRTLPARSIRWYDGALLGSCLVIFFWTRPFEGFFASVMIGMPLLYQLVRSQGMGVVLWPLLPGCLLVLAPALWVQSELNLACTGSRTRLPYLEHEQQYGLTPLFLMQPVRTEAPDYRHEQLRVFNDQMLDWYYMQKAPRHLLTVAKFKFGVGWVYFYCLLWLFPLATLPELWGCRGSRLLLAVWFGLLLLLQCVCWFLHHYAAPAFPAWSLLIMFSIRIACTWKYKDFPLGRFLVVLLVSGYCSQILFERVMASVYSKQSWTEQRAQLIGDMLQQGDRHLVLLRYGTGHDTGQEWVYNSADIPDQKIIWARSMNPEKDQELIGLYPQRQVWLLEVNSKMKDQIPQLQHYLPRQGSPSDHQ